MMEQNIEPEKKKGNGLWIGLTALFFITTAVLAFLYLTKKEMLSVVFVDKDNDVKIVKVEKGKTVAKPEGTKEDFLGWYYNDTEFDFGTKINQDCVIIAKYDERKMFTVTFDTDGGSTIDPVKVKENETVKKPTNPTKDGLVLNKWTLDGAEYDFSTPVTKDITLKATWMENDNKVAVHFDANGGSKVADQRVGVGAAVKKPNNPTRYGYSFKEWQLNGEAYDFTKPVESEITLKAVWTEKAKVTLSFDANGGSAVASKQVYVQEKVGTLPTSTRSGYVFIRWDLNGATFNANSMVTKNTTVKAIWKTEDEYNYDNALAAIKSSYDITKDGQTISVTSKGCTITHDPIKLNGSSNITIKFNIKCGSKEGSKNATGKVKLPTYTYTIVKYNDNKVNADVRINGVTSGCLYYANSDEQVDPNGIRNGMVVISNSDLEGNPTFRVQVGQCGAGQPVYTVKKG